MVDERLRVAIAVIGGGPAGSSAALTLARAGVPTAIVDRRSTTAFRPGEALPPAAVQALRGLGRTDLQRGRHLPAYGVRACWGSPELASRDFIFSPYGHGWHLDRRQFDEDGLSSAKAAGVRVIRTSHPIQMEWNSREVGVAVRAGGRRLLVTAGYVIDCSGRAAVVARSRGIRRIRHDGLVAVSQLLISRTPIASDRDDATTTIEAGPNGWWYTCRIPGDRRVLSYLTDADLLPRNLRTDSSSLMESLGAARHIAHLCHPSSWQADGPVSVCRAESSRLVEVTGDRWLAVGDAACAFDPLSSTGVLSAVVSARRGAEAALRWLCHDRPAAAAYAESLTVAWRQYLRERDEQYSHETRWANHPFWERRVSA
jgi:flavin-dependent dehydrogenase